MIQAWLGFRAVLRRLLGTEPAEPGAAGWRADAGEQDADGASAGHDDPSPGRAPTEPGAAAPVGAGPRGAGVDRPGADADAPAPPGPALPASGAGANQAPPARPPARARPGRDRLAAGSARRGDGTDAHERWLAALVARFADPPAREPDPSAAVTPGEALLRPHEVRALVAAVAAHPGPDEAHGPARPSTPALPALAGGAPEPGAAAPPPTGVPPAAADERPSLDGLWRRIDALVAAGHDRLAAEWLEKLVAALPAGDDRDLLRLRAAELRHDRGDREAIAHLEVLAASRRHGARAHFLLGEHHRRHGDARLALRHLEAVLALDIAHAGARARVEALRATLGPAAPVPAVPDATLAGPHGAAATAGARYRLSRELGRGATGVVYEARDEELGRGVAVKLLHAHLGAAAGGPVARFFAEARVAAALRHPHVVAILDLDETHRRIVMELAEGGTLRARLADGPLPPAEALTRHVEVLAALAAAHRGGVVHRDLKPSNLLYRQAEAPAELVLCDFGASHLVAAGGGGVPGGTPGGAVGTLRYMSPEARRGLVDPRGDVYAAGVILAETLAGPAHGAPLLADRPPDLPPALRASLGTTRANLIAAHLAALCAPTPEDRPAADDALRAARRLADVLLDDGP